MKKRIPTAHLVFYSTIIVLIGLLIAFFVWVHYETAVITSQHFKLLECTDRAHDQHCKVTYTLTNETDHKITTDLNGINGPGFAESGVAEVFAILDDGTSITIHAGSQLEYDSNIYPHETVQLTDQFFIPLDRSVSAIKIRGETFNIKF